MGPNSQPKIQPRAVLTGESGVGKSTVALELAYRAIDSEPELSIFWVNAVDEANINSSFLSIWTELGSPTGPTDDPKRCLQYYLTWSMDQPWLMILDGLVPESLQYCAFGSFIPDGLRGSLLFTTAHDYSCLELLGSVSNIPVSRIQSYFTRFDQQGAPDGKNFVERPLDLAPMEECLLPQHQTRSGKRNVFVIHGLSGIGKTELAAGFARKHITTFSFVLWLDGRTKNQLRQSIANYAEMIPKSQKPEKPEALVSATEDSLESMVLEVLEWLARPDNSNWLLVFDGLDLDHGQAGIAEAYDVREYLPSNHGSILVTTRLSGLAQLGDSLRLKKVDEQLSYAIFKQWYGSNIGELHETHPFFYSLSLTKLRFRVRCKIRHPASRWPTIGFGTSCLISP